MSRHLQGPDSLPVLAATTVLWALSNFESVRGCCVAVAATRTAGTLIVDPEGDLTQRAASLDHESNGFLRLTAERLGHSQTLTRKPNGN